MGLFFSDTLIKDANRVNIDVKNKPLIEALDACFAQNPHLHYFIRDNMIVLKRKPEIVFRVSGKVLNTEGEPLVSASIVVSRTGRGAQTDANGNFLLRGIKASDSIMASYTGYESQRMIISGEDINYTFTLNRATSELDQVLTQAYGTTSQRFITGNIAKITAAEIERQPVMNVMQAIQGRVPNVVVTQTSGYASAPLRIEIRGRSTIDHKFTSDPLYIIDGVPLTVLELTTGNYASGSLGYIQNGFNGPAKGLSPFFSFNPNDIESIEVLKDADATAIYGSRGANGVLLITTKKGKAGKTNVEMNVFKGISKATRRWEMLNTQQYLQMRREAFANDNQPMNLGNAYDLLVWDTTRSTDWQDYLWGGTGRVTDVQMNVNGGDTKTQFRVGAAFHTEKDIMAVSGSNDRRSLSFHLNHKNLDNRFTLSLTGNYANTKSDMTFIPNAATLPPIAPPVYTATGKLNYAGWLPAQFPFANLLQPYNSKSNTLTSNITLGYTIIKGLHIRSSFGYTNAQVNQLYLAPIASLDPAGNPTGSSRFGNNIIQNWIIEPQVEYSSIIGKGQLTFLAGATSQANKTEGTTIYGTGYTNDAYLRSPALAPSTQASGNFGQYKYAALFARANYILLNRYIINISGRRDGSSRFGPGKQFGNFGAVGVAWIFSEEKWFKHHLDILSFGKIRASYGTTGSDAVGDYKYLTRWSGGINTPPYAGYPGIEPLQHSNPEYHWQLNRKLEAGLSLGFLNDRISLNITWYRNRCGNQLISFILPAFTGFTEVINNSAAAVQNSGWEYTINATIINNGKFKWEINGNMGTNRNKLLRYEDLDQSPYANIYIVGQSLNIQKLLHYTGVDPETGQYAFEDIDKDGTIDASASSKDKIVIDNSPEYMGGIGTRLKSGAFELFVFANFVKQRGYNALLSTFIAGTISNQPASVLGRWQKPGDVSDIARFTTLGANSDLYFYYLSDGIFTNASFLRLQNLSASYTFPDRFFKKAGFKNVRIYVQGQNLATITNYKGIDPETQNFGGFPPTKVFTAGIRFTY